MPFPSVSGAGVLAYSPAGNRATQTDPVTSDVTTFTDDNGNRLLTGLDVSGTTTYTYDNNGNQLTIEEPSRDITTNTWDGENRLVQVEVPSGDVTTSACNGDGLRDLQGRKCSVVQSAVFSELHFCD
jgi:YD repeat-containing protein